MSFMDRIKALFSGGSGDGDAHAGHDHAGAADTHEPVAPPMPPADPAGMPTGEAIPSEDETRPV